MQTKYFILCLRYVLIGLIAISCGSKKKEVGFRIQTDVANCQVFINGQLAGNTPLEVTLPLGTATIEVKKEGYAHTYTRQLDVSEGMATTLELPIAAHNSKIESEQAAAIAAEKEALRREEQKKIREEKQKQRERLAALRKAEIEKNSQALQTFAAHTAPVMSLCFSGNGRYAFSAGSWDRSVKMWEMSTGKVVRSFGGYSDLVRCAAVSPDDNYLLSGVGDGSLLLTEVKTGKVIRNLVGHTDLVKCVAFSPDGRYAASGANDSNIIIWDVAKGAKIRTLAGHSSDIESLAFSLDGRFILSGGGSWVSKSAELYLWDVATGQTVRSFTGHTNRIRSLAFSPDGRYFVSGSADRTIKLWEVATGKCSEYLDGAPRRGWFCCVLSRGTPCRFWL